MFCFRRSSRLRIFVKQVVCRSPSQQFPWIAVHPSFRLFHLLVCHFVKIGFLLEKASDHPVHALIISSFIRITVNDMMFCSWTYSLSVDRRKSRSNSFSIRNRLFSYLYSDNIFAGLRPRDFGIPCLSSLLFLL